VWKRFRPPVDFIPSLTRADRCLKTRALIFLTNNKQHTVNALVMWWRGWVLRLYHRFVLKGTPNSKITLLKLVFVYVICYGGYHRPIFSCADGYGSLGWDWFVLMGFEVNLHQDNQLVLKICLALRRTKGTDTQIFLTPLLFFFLLSKTFARCLWVVESGNRQELTAEMSNFPSMRHHKDRLFVGNHRQLVAKTGSRYSQVATVVWWSVPCPSSQSTAQYSVSC